MPVSFFHGVLVRLDREFSKLQIFRVEQDRKQGTVEINLISLLIPQHLSLIK